MYECLLNVTKMKHLFLEGGTVTKKKRKKEKEKIHENNQLRKKHIHDFY